MTDVLPFHTVYLHAMVRDKDGRKMSKSLGNVIDPLEVINGCALEKLLNKLDSGNLPEKEVLKAKKDQSADFPDGIPECGSDALRFGLLAYTVQGRDINLDIKRVVGYRQFCNKLWNATKFALQFITDFKPTATLLSDLMTSQKMAVRDKFMISRLMKGVDAVNKKFESYLFGDAQHAAYALWLNDLCDVYLELVKPVIKNNEEDNKDSKWAAQATLWVTLEVGLRLLHPMMPFVTEELWQRLPGRGTLGESEKSSIMIADFPECNKDYLNDDAESSMETTMKVVKACRSLRSSYNIANKLSTHFFVKIMGKGIKELEKQIDDVKTLGKASHVDINPNDNDIPSSVGLVVVDDQTKILMDLTGLINFDAEIKKLEKSLKKTTPAMENLERKMKAPGYEKNVKEDLKKANIEKLESLKKKVADIVAGIDNFKKLAQLESQ